MSSINTQLMIFSLYLNIQIKNKQLRMQMILDSKKVPYKLIDIATEDGAKQTMRDGVGDEKALPPQIFKGDKYLGVSSTLYYLLLINICTTVFLKMVIWPIFSHTLRVSMTMVITLCPLWLTA